MIHELLSAGFAVTGVTRVDATNSTPKFPDSLPVKKVDYGSFDALRDAFRGQDAVVSVVGTAAVAVVQRTAIDAAVAAGVKRFVPSEFGIHTRKVRGSPIGSILAGKIGVVDYLEEVAQREEGFSWTGLSTGLFFDWVCPSPSTSNPTPPVCAIYHEAVYSRACTGVMANTGMI